MDEPLPELVELETVASVLEAASANMQDADVAEIVDHFLEGLHERIVELGGLVEGDE